MMDSNTTTYLAYIERLAETDKNFFAVLQVVKSLFAEAAPTDKLKSQYGPFSDAATISGDPNHYTANAAEFPYPMVFRQEGKIMEMTHIPSPDYADNIYNDTLIYSVLGLPLNERDEDALIQKAKHFQSIDSSLLYQDKNSIHLDNLVLDSDDNYVPYKMVNMPNLYFNRSSLSSHYKAEYDKRLKRYLGTGYELTDHKRDAASRLLEFYTTYGKENPRFNKVPNPIYFGTLAGISLGNTITTHISRQESNSSITLNSDGVINKVDVNLNVEDLSLEQGDRISEIVVAVSVDGITHDVVLNGSNPLDVYKRIYSGLVNSGNAQVSSATIIHTVTDTIDNTVFVDQLFSFSGYQDYATTLQVDSNFLNPLFINGEQLENYLLMDDQINGPHKYDDIYVHVGKTDFETYWDSIAGTMPSLRKAASTFLNSASKLSNEDLGKPGLFVNDVVRNTLGINLLQKKEDAIADLERKYLVTDSEDPEYGALNGMIIGQTRGAEFRTVIDGFYNSGTDRKFKEGDPGWTIKKEVERIMGSMPNPLPDFEKTENRIQWYLPHTNPNIYGIDHRLVFGAKVKPTSNDIRTLFKDLQNNYFIPNNDNPGMIAAALASDGINIVKQAGINLYDFIGGTVSAITGGALDKLTGVNFDNPNNSTSYLDRYVPDLSEYQENNLTSFDRALGLIIQGKDAQPVVQPLLPLQTHRDVVVNTPLCQRGKWFIVDKIVEIEQGADYWLSNFAIDMYSRPDFPNIKTSYNGQMLDDKQTLVNSGQIFEGTQQVDGSIKGLSYDGLSLTGGGVAQSNSTYLVNVPAAHISTLLGESSGQIRMYDTLSPESLASLEPQYFPFYIRTISRDDYVLVQQPFYDNHTVFMSKQKISGNAIVFLDATIENINELFNSIVEDDFYLGRVEPILNYKGTQRTFSFEFTLPVSRPSDVPAVRDKKNALIQMMYPQLQTIAEVGVVGFRRGPLVEIRIGDEWLLQGMIQSMNVQSGMGQGATTWETIPGGRVPRGCKITMNMKIVHREQPSASFDFYSPTFNRDVFLEPNRIGTFTKAQTNNLNPIPGIIQNMTGNTLLSNFV